MLMANGDWKKDIQDKLDKALKDKTLNQTLYDLLKKLLAAAETAGEFAEVLEKEGILRKLGSIKSLGAKAGSFIVGILIQLVEAGPCPWTGIIVARINKLIQDLLAGDDTVAERNRLKELWALKRKYTTAFTKCQRLAFRGNGPKDINNASLRDFASIRVNARLAKAILREAKDDPFQTPNEVLRVRGVTRDLQIRLLKGGFVFGSSGSEQLKARTPGRSAKRIRA
jgi:hypothetical protein